MFIAPIDVLESKAQSLPFLPLHAAPGTGCSTLKRPKGRLWDLRGVIPIVSMVAPFSALAN